MKRTDFRFHERLRVRWAEIDAQQIVFNGNYLTYFDTAISGYWRALAMPYAPTMVRLGGDLFMRKASVEYVDSARYDDLLQVGMRMARIGNSSIVFEGAVFRDDRLLASAELVYVFADPVARTAQRVPDALRELLLAHEAGEPMVEVRLGGWGELGLHARSLRHEVFVSEQGLHADLEVDAHDETARHVVALNRFGQALATGRLLQEGPGIGRIGRLACIQALRGSGVGQAVLSALLDAARVRGDTGVVLGARTHALDFYRRAGFEVAGEAYEEGGVAHVPLVRLL